MGVRRLASIRERSARAKTALKTLNNNSSDNNNNDDSHSNNNHCDNCRGNEEELREELDEMRARESALLRSHAHVSACANEWRGFAAYTQRLLQQELDTYGARLSAALHENARLMLENAALRAARQRPAPSPADSDGADSVGRSECNCAQISPTSSSSSSRISEVPQIRSQSALSFGTVATAESVAHYDGNRTESSTQDEILAHNARVLRYIDSLAQRITKLELDEEQSATTFSASQLITDRSYNNNDSNNNDNNAAGLMSSDSRIRLPSLRLLNASDATPPAFDAWRDNAASGCSGAQRASSASADSAFSNESTGSVASRDRLPTVQDLVRSSSGDDDEDDLPPEMPQLTIAQLSRAHISSLAGGPALMSPLYFARTFADDFAASPRPTVHHDGTVRASTLTLPSRRQQLSGAPPTQRLRIRMLPTAPAPAAPNFLRQFDASAPPLPFPPGAQCSPV